MHFKNYYENQSFIYDNNTISWLLNRGENYSN